MAAGRIAGPRRAGRARTRPTAWSCSSKARCPSRKCSSSCIAARTTGSRATDTQIRRESSQRVRPGCPHFGLHTGACGGCKMQHLDAAAQVAVKQRALEDNLGTSARSAENLLRPLEGPAWHYRYRARLSVRHVVKKGVVLIGFHERKSRYIADMQVCPVLPEQVSAHADAAARADRPRWTPRDLPRRSNWPAAMRPVRPRWAPSPWCYGTWSPCRLRRHRPAEGLCREERRRAVVVAGQGPGDGEAAGRGRYAARWPLPEFGVGDAVQAGPTSRRSIRTSTARWCGKALAPARCAIRRTRHRLVLRPRQLHPAAGEPGAREVLGIEGSDTRWWRARTDNLRKNRACNAALDAQLSPTRSSRATCSR